MAYDIGPKIGIDGEAEFRRELQNINQGLKTLGSEMAVVTSEFIGNENSVEALTAKNDVLGRTVEKLNEKLEAQQRMLRESAQTYGEADSRTQKWQQKVNRTTAELNRAEAQIRQNNDALAELNEETDDASESTSSLNDALSDLGIQLPTAEDMIKAAADAVKAFAKWCADAVVDAAAFADEILTLSTNYGIATDRLQEYQYMAELTDTSVDTITSSISRLTRSMNSARDGTGEAADAFAALGINILDANDQLLDSEDVFNAAIDALGQIENETERDALSMTIFGKSAMDLNSLIATGAEGIAAYAEEARKMGYVLSEEQLGVLGQVDDQFQRLDLAMQAAKNRMAAEMGPAIIELTEELIKLIQTVDWEQVGRTVGQMIHELIPLIDSVVTGIVRITDACTAAGEAIDKVGAAIERLFGAGGSTVHRGSFGGSSGFGSVRGYATGGVFEPNHPMVIGVGDNTSERELLAPESAFRNILRDELGGYSGQVTVVVKNPPTTDNQLVRSLTPQVEAYTSLRGGTL